MVVSNSLMFELPTSIFFLTFYFFFMNENSNLIRYAAITSLSEHKGWIVNHFFPKCLNQQVLFFLFLFSFLYFIFWLVINHLRFYHARIKETSRCGTYETPLALLRVLLLMINLQSLPLLFIIMLPFLP